MNWVAQWIASLIPTIKYLGSIPIVATLFFAFFQIQ